MRIFLDKKMIIEILEKYYQEQLDITGKINITADKQFGSYGFSDIEESLIKIELIGSINLLGKKQKTKVTITTDEMLEAIKYYIEQEGYIFKGYELDKGLHEETTGYGLSEETKKTPYFNGVQINVDTKNKIKEMKKNEY